MAAKKRAPRGKFTKTEVERHVKAVEAAVEKARREHTGEQFAGITADEIREALAKVESPFISFVGWGPVSAGGTVNITVGVFNPDPPPSAGSLFLHVFVGPTSGVADAGEYFLNIDPRFPHLMQPGEPGFSLASGATTAFTFSFTAPASIEATNYCMNAALVRAPVFSPGSLLSRSIVALTVQ